MIDFPFLPLKEAKNSKKRLNMRKILVVFLTVLLMISLFGCGGKKNNDGRSHVVMWIMPNSQEPVNDLYAVMKPFLDANPDIELTITSLDWGSAWQKITTAATSRDVPDIVQLGTTWVGSISSMGALSNLNVNIDNIGGKDLFIPAAWSTSGIVGSGEVTAIPWIVDIRAMYYRTDIFKELGLTAKDVSTWEKFEATLNKIKAANLTINNKKVEPFGITGKNDWNVIHNLAPWIWSAGGDIVSDDFKKSGLGTDEALSGMVFYTGLVRKGLVPLRCLEQNTYQISTDFNNGFYAIYFDGPFALKGLTTPPERGGSAGTPVAKNFAVAPYPAGVKGRATFCGGSNLAIFKASKNKEAAWKVVEYLTTNDEAQTAYTKLTGFLPAKKSAFSDPYFSNDPFRKVFYDSVSFSKAFPCIPAWGPIETVVLTRRFGLLWDEVVKNPDAFDQTKVKAQLDLAVNEMNVVLEQQ
jgi:multiple sugar transport system substrate-binding protein